MQSVQTMKQTLLKTLAVLILAGSSLCTAAAEGPLPFEVKVGEQTATHKAGEPFAQIEKPVAADAGLSIGSKAEMTIINVHKTVADGVTPDQSAQPAIIILQNTNAGKLDQTMDKQKLSPGKYLLSITSGENTATIKFEVK
jgi:hypothetical protein